MVLSEVCIIEFYIEAKRHYCSMSQTERLLSGFLFSKRCVVYRRRIDEHASARQVPVHRLAQGFLFHTPRIERSQRSHNVRDALLATSARGCNGCVIENGMNVDQRKISYVCIEPHRERSGILEGIAQ